MATSDSAPKNVFLTVPLREKVVVHPMALTKQVNDVVLQRLEAKFEGLCSHHGYIRGGSIKVTGISPGQVRSFTLNGDVEYTVDFVADVCNPCKGSLLHARVVNINRFGALAEVYIDNDDSGLNRSPVMEIVIPRIQVAEVSKEPVDESARIDGLHIGTMCTIVVLGKRFQLNDRKLSVLGRLATDDEAAQYQLRLDSEPGGCGALDDCSDADDADDLGASDESSEEDGEEEEENACAADFSDEFAEDTASEDSYNEED